MNSLKFDIVSIVIFAWKIMTSIFFLLISHVHLQSDIAHTKNVVSYYFR